MIHILLCCGGGFSSSALAAKVKKDIQQYQLEDKFEIEFSPFMIAKKKWTGSISSFAART